MQYIIPRDNSKSLLSLTESNSNLIVTPQKTIHMKTSGLPYKADICHTSETVSSPFRSNSNNPKLFQAGLNTYQSTTYNTRNNNTQLLSRSIKKEPNKVGNGDYIMPAKYRPKTIKHHTNKFSFKPQTNNLIKSPFL